VRESLFLMPFAGWAAGGGGPGPQDPAGAGITSMGTSKAPPEASFGQKTDELLRQQKEKKERDKALMRKRLESLPNRQIPGEFPAYSWGGYERKDWNYRWGKIPAEALTRTPLSLLGEREGTEPLAPPPGEHSAPAATGQVHTDPNAAKKMELHREANQLKQEIAKLHIDIQNALQASRQRHATHSMSQGLPLQRGTTVPALPRARFTPTGAPVEAFEVQPMSAAGHFTTPKNFSLDSVSQHIMGLRAQLSQKKVRLAQIRQQLHQLSGMSKVQSTPIPGMRPSTMQAKPIAGHVTALNQARAKQVPGAPKPMKAPKPKPLHPVGAGAHHESQDRPLRLTGDQCRWRSLLN
jgi:hypothetical protein